MFAQSAWAIATETMENDSNSIDLPGYIPPPPGGGGGGTGYSEGDGTDVYGVPTTTPADASNIPSPTGDASLTLGTNGVSSGSDADAAKTLADALTNAGAFTSTSNQSSNYADDGSSGYFFSGSAIRSVLGSNGITQLIIRGWDPVTKKYVTVGTEVATSTPLKGQSLAQNRTDMAALAATVSMNDTRVGDVSINGTRMSLSYKTSGRILALIPITFTIRVDVNAALVNKLERVTIHYPWYRFLLWLTIPEVDLRDAIDQAVLDSQKEAVDVHDAEARLFLGVTNALRAKHAEYEGGIRIIL